MKKIILAVFIIGLLLSCKDENPKTDDNVTTNEKMTKKVTALTSGCSHDTIVIIDKKKVKDLNNWYETIKNKEFVCSEYLDVYCFDNYVVDLTKIANQDTAKPNDEQKVAKWLKANTNNICYEASYSYIEKNHVIDDINYQSAINFLISKKSFTTYTINKLINTLPDFEKNNYEKYAEISVDSSNKIVFNMIDDYIAGTHCYSLPFFKSVIYVNKIKKSEYDDYKLEFVKFDLSNTVKVYAFKLSNKDNSVVKFYNYSTNPGKTGAVRLTNAFI